jgi:two-component sensor histidine kinase
MFSQAQYYADKNYYLIDSLNLNNVIKSEKELIHKSLLKYHKSKSQEFKLKAINLLIENSWDDSVWPKYNQWMFDFTKQELANKLPISNIENLNTKDKMLLKFYSKSVNNFGYIFNNEGKMSKALEYYYKSLNFREMINDSLGLAESYNNIGNVYAIQDDLENALKYTEKSVLVSRLIGSKEHSTILINMGNLYGRKGDNKKAMSLYQESLELNKSLNNAVGRANSLRMIAAIYKKEGEFDKSLVYLLENLGVLEENGYQEGVIGSLISISRIYLQKEDIKKAKYYADRAMILSKKKGDPSRISIVSELLSSIYQKDNNWKKALEMEKLHYKMRDSIKNEVVQNSLIEQASEYELGKKQQEIELLSAKNVIQELRLLKNKNSITLILIALFLTLLIAFVSYRGYKKNLLINKLLEKQKSEISRQNEAKKTMLQEIHHRVKNNLQVVNSLLRMQSSKMKDKNILGMFKETQSRIRSMAKLHEKMYQSGDLDKFNAKEHITLLVEEIVTNYSVGKTIELNLDIDAIFVDSKTMMPLSLIINEMISNSLKYAFEGREEGTIEVKFNKVKNEKTQLIIRDNGVGYTPNPKSKGLGLRLITSFTKQLNGQMEKITNNGTTFKLIY